MAYVDLTRSLGLDQPFYGIQAQGLENDQEPYRRVEEMAENYIEAMRSVQPEGPYLLIGWSFGFLVAYEMAQQLHAQGQEVALLVSLDRGNDLHQRPYEIIDDASFWLWRFGSEISLSLEHLRQLSPEEQLDYVTKKLSAEGKLPGYLKYVDLDRARRVLKVDKSNREAEWDYVPQPYPGRIILFRASEQPSACFDDATWGWGELALGGVEVYNMFGHHGNVASQKPIIEQLIKCIDRIHAEYA